ncbi:MAG: phosphoribosylformylglycinamidine synthase subunit PurL [Candidatus Bathyarchaeota archaeon]|nr:MAG: phosphoribosylformylglycinamidine synthase subunit PurL [Candidatus Bathyarchaeota archaeon]
MSLKGRYKEANTHFPLFKIQLSDADEGALLAISNEMGLGLNREEMTHVKTYFVKKSRDPTDVELQTLGQTWSEHCYHKTFKGDITTDKGIIHGLLKSYIAKATRELDHPWCYSVFEDNAGIIEFERGFLIASKVETHNHPSAIEPFGGAATGTGGVIRDPLGVWAEPIACTDVLGFGPLDYDVSKLPRGIKHPSYILRGVVAGIGTYGNNMGIPTVNGAIIFDDSYVGNVVVYCGCIGIIPPGKYVKDTREGDIALLVGGRTGRDGIHGVTFASAELTQESEETSRSAVQIPNPIEEERMKRAILSTRNQELGSGITDLGGGGLSSAIGEMAYRSGCGVEVDLEKIPLKATDLAPWEIYISESQERMLLSVRKENLDEVLSIFKTEDVLANPIGVFTSEKRLKVRYQGYTVADLDMDFLFSPPKIRYKAEWRRKTFPEPELKEPKDLTSHLKKLLSSPNIASKESVVRTYDHEVKGNTVLKPFQGKYAGPNDGAVIKPLDDSWRGVAISCGINSEYGKIDPYWMAASSIDEAIRNNIAVGGQRIALLDNFTWGNPDKPDRLGDLVQAVKACYDFAKAFETPFISGKDSLFNESPLGPITPTLLITAVGIVPDIRKVVSMEVKRKNSLLYLIGVTRNEMGGSAYYLNEKLSGGHLPKVDGPLAKKTFNRVSKAIDNSLLLACHDLSEGGLGVAAAEMMFSGEWGATLDLAAVTRENLERNDLILFSESNSRFLVEVTPRRRKEFEKLMGDIPISLIGRVNSKDEFIVKGINGTPVVTTSLKSLREAWKNLKWSR